VTISASRVLVCDLCDRDDLAIDKRGFCFRLDKWGHIIEGCVPLVDHLRRELKHKGEARLRTKTRTVQEAKRIFAIVAQAGHFSVTYEEGDSWVKAFPTEDIPPQPIEPKPRTKDGFVISELDPGALIMEYTEQKHRLSLMEQMVQLDPGSVSNLPREREILATIERQMQEIDDARRSD